MKLFKKGFNWASGLFIIGYHLLLLVALPVYLYLSLPVTLGLVISCIAIYAICGLSITVGYHRYFSHNSFKTNRVIEAILLLFGTLATQGSALRWSFEHRLHHAYVDTDKDPYSIKKGFWYAHFLWLFEPDIPINNKVVSDLLKSPLIHFQHKYYPYLMLAVNALVILAFGALFGNFFGAFLFVGLIRLFFLHHSTWFINSLAHVWGSRSYSKEHSAVDNYLVSLVTFGEGYHNYHHTFANDYRNGTRWYHFDPSKWVIWSLNKLKLATNLRKVNSLAVKKKQLLVEKPILFESLKSKMGEKGQQVQEVLEQLSSNLRKNIDSIHEMKQMLKKLKSNAINDIGHKKSSMKKEIQLLKSKVRSDWKQWMVISKAIMDKKRMQAITAKVV